MGYCESGCKLIAASFKPQAVSNTPQRGNAGCKLKTANRAIGSGFAKFSDI